MGLGRLLRVRLKSEINSSPSMVMFVRSGISKMALWSYFEFRVNPLAGHQHEEIHSTALAHVVVDERAPDPEDRAREALAKAHYEIEEATSVAQIDPEQLKARIPEIHSQVLRFGVGFELVAWK